MADAADSVISQSTQVIVKPNYVTNTDTFQNVTRISQQKILPTSITNRFYSQLVSFSDVTYTPFTVPNGSSAVLTSTIVDNASRVILAIPQTSIYIGINNHSQILPNGANQWPTSLVGGGNFPVYFNPFDWGQSNDVNQVSQVICRNNTGSDQQVLGVVQWKILTVPGTTANASS